MWNELATESVRMYTPTSSPLLPPVVTRALGTDTAVFDCAGLTAIFVRANVLSAPSDPSREKVKAFRGFFPLSSFGEKYTVNSWSVTWGPDTSFSGRVMKYEVESDIKVKLFASGTEERTRKKNPGMFWCQTYKLCTRRHFQPVQSLLKKHYHTSWYYWRLYTLQQ